MTPTIAGILLIGIGLILAGMATFAWPTLSRLPAHRLRSWLYGSAAARILAIIGGLLLAGVGAYLLVGGRGL